MAELDYRTAGESHGQVVLAYVEGLPADLHIDNRAIDGELVRRQGGYGRGTRQRIERDRVQIVSGVRAGRTIGAPVVLQVTNRDFRIDQAPPIHRPRPGHADLAGAIKFLTTDCRSVLERASARETAGRVAAGALAKCLLAEFGIRCVGFVIRVGAAAAKIPDDLPPDTLLSQRDANDVYCPDPNAVEPMTRAIRQAKRNKDTLGGVVEVRVFGCPPGIGSCMRWQDRLSARLMYAVGSVQAIKAVAIGAGFSAAALPGSQVHDEIDFDPAERDGPTLGFVRRTNHAGGLEGGMTNGQTVVVRAAMKPISTLLRGLDSVNLATLQPERSDYERSDVCAVPACSVVIENVVAFEIARGFRAKFGGDTLTEVRSAYEHFLAAARRLPDAGKA